MTLVPLAADLLVARLQFIELLVGKVFDVDHLVVRLVDRPDHLVELQVQRLGVPVLRVLDKEDDQEREDGRRGVNDKLPGVRVPVDWAHRSPKNYRSAGKQKCQW